jgi:hypothetical protein
MGTINITCAQCGRQLAVPERYQGRDLTCPSCGHPFRADPPQAATVPLPVPGPKTEVFPDATPPTPPTPTAAPFGEPAASAQQADAAGVAEAAFAEATAVYWRVRRIGVLSLAALSALLHATLGLVVGVVLAIASLTPAAQAIPFLHGPLLGVLAVVLLPIGYGVMGFAAGAVAAVVYNLGARIVGGVRILLE